MNLWTTSLRRLLGDLGRGGSSWSVSRASSGDGVTSDTTPASAGTLAGYVIEQLPPSLAVALAQTQASQHTYWLLTAASPRIGDVIQSAATTSLIYTIRSISVVAGLTLCRLTIGGTVATSGGSSTIRRGMWIGIRAVPTYATDH